MRLLAATIATVTLWTLMECPYVVDAHDVNENNGATNVRRRSASRTVLEELGTPSGGSVTKLRLINADTDQPIAQYDPLPKEVSIDISTLPSTNLNIEAITTGTVTSIQWSYNGVVRDEYNPRWAMCGNGGNDFYACTSFQNGFNGTITAMPSYNGKPGLGASTKLSLLTPTTGVSTMSLVVVDADTDKIVGPLLNTTVIDVAKTPNVNFVADVAKSINFSSVVFRGIDGIVGVENSAPYAYFGNAGDNYHGWIPKMMGQYTVTAETYSDRNGQGRIRSNIVATFSVENSTGIPSPVATPIAPPIFSPIPSPRATMAPTTVTTDRVPPKLISLFIANTTLDISTMASTYAEIVVQDDRSGMASTVFGASAHYKEHLPIEVFERRLTGNQTVTYNGTLYFSGFAGPGKYPLFVQLRDKADNFISWNSSSLARLNFPSTITLIRSTTAPRPAPIAPPVAPPRATASPTSRDTTPPKLINLVLEKSRLDMSLSANVFSNVQLTVQDDQSGMYRCLVGAKAISPYHVPREFYEWSQTGNQTVTYNGTLQFMSLFTPATFQLYVWAMDKNENYFYWNSSMLRALNLPYNITLFHSATRIPTKAPTKAPALAPTKAPVPAPKTAPVARDTLAPKLIRFFVANTTLNLSSSTSTYAEIVVQDDQSGMSSTVFGAQAHYKEHLPLEFFERRKTGNQTVTYNGTLRFSSLMSTGSYPLFVQLRDNADNFMSWNSTVLAGLNFPSSITLFR